MGERNGKTRKSLSGEKHEIVFDEKELKAGIEHEKEHAVSLRPFLKDDVNIIDVLEAITKDHLKKIPDYYTRLENMERSYEDEKSKKQTLETSEKGVNLASLVLPQVLREVTPVDTGSVDDRVVLTTPKKHPVEEAGSNFGQLGYCPKIMETVTASCIVDKFLKGENVSDLVAQLALDVGVRGVKSSYDIVGVMSILDEEPDWKVICRRKGVIFGESISRANESLYSSKDEAERDKVTGDLKMLTTQLDMLSQKMKAKAISFKEKEIYRFLGGDKIEEDIAIIDSFIESIEKVVNKLKEVVDDSYKYVVGDLAVLVDKLVEVYGDYKNGAEIVSELIDGPVKVLIGG